MLGERAAERWEFPGVSRGAPRLLVFQHIAVEHPGILRDFLAADGIAWDVVELDCGEAIPALDAYDGLWVMGGPMDVWEEQRYPWLVQEKAAISEAVVERELAYFGLCLGHQLLAAALGGAVAKGTAEVGVMAVELNAAGRDSPFYRDLPTTLKCLQWHGAEVTAAPPGARVLAQSPACANQTMAIGQRAFSAQFHIEVNTDTIAEWGSIPVYADALHAAMGADAVARLQAEVAAQMPNFNRYAKKLYDNWIDAAGLRARLRDGGAAGDG